MYLLRRNKLRLSLKEVTEVYRRMTLKGRIYL